MIGKLMRFLKMSRYVLQNKQAWRFVPDSKGKDETTISYDLLSPMIYTASSWNINYHHGGYDDIVTSSIPVGSIVELDALFVNELRDAAEAVIRLEILRRREQELTDTVQAELNRRLWND